MPYNFKKHLEEINAEFKNHSQDFDDMQNYRKDIGKSIETKSNDVKDNLSKELVKCADEMKRHFSHQKAENSRLQQQITQLKSEKTVLDNQLQGVRKRIEDIEAQIGKGM